MNTKPKACKGTKQAKGQGCGNVLIPFRLGLCYGCYKDWLFGTPEGIEYSKKFIIRSKKETEKKEKVVIEKMKENIEKKSDFEKILERIVNTIVRLMDDGKGCISCGCGWGGWWPEINKKHAGHFFTVGSHPSIRFNVHNIYLQCEQCNRKRSGNLHGYRKGIAFHYSLGLLIYMDKLPQLYPELHLTKEDLKEAIKKANRIKRELLAGASYTRDEVNEQIGIYKN